jgi:polar amino acid transport system substrate-binding protein
MGMHGLLKTRPGKRARSAVLAAVAISSLALLAAGCGSSSSASSGSVKGLQDAKVLRVCGVNDYPPMQYLEGGKLTGFDYEIEQALAKKLGVTDQHQSSAFDGILAGMQAGRCDVAWGSMYLTDERLQTADGIAYFKSGFALVVPAGNPKKIESCQDLSGTKVAVQASTLQVPKVQELSKEFKAKGEAGIDIKQYPKTPDTFQQILVHRADAVMDTDVALAYLAKQRPNDFEFVKCEDPDAVLALYVKRGSALQQEITDSLKSLKADGTLSKIAKKYGYDPANFDIRSVDGKS